jgi:hypothetical protein
MTDNPQRIFRNELKRLLSKIKTKFQIWSFDVLMLTYFISYDRSIIEYFDTRLWNKNSSLDRYITFKKSSWFYKSLYILPEKHQKFGNLNFRIVGNITPFVWFRVKDASIEKKRRRRKFDLFLADFLDVNENKLKKGKNQRNCRSV